MVRRVLYVTNLRCVYAAIASPSLSLDSGGCGDWKKSIGELRDDNRIHHGRAPVHIERY